MFLLIHYCNNLRECTNQLNRHLSILNASEPQITSGSPGRMLTYLTEAKIHVMTQINQRNPKGLRKNDNAMT
ncbi:MAG TPA: hypothetical protein VLY03_00625 [Bacteroidota bacterium]|nr:hypothetical protein [Bacteroidota bacterium]